jgi:hypothetical protein
MSTKKILLLSLTILTLPLILILQPLTNEVNNTDKINKIVTNLYQCYDLPVAERERCSLLNLNTNLSLADNLMLIKKIDNDIIDNKKIKNLCHDITHIIGTAAYNNHEDNSLISGYESCGQGYYHGIMSELLVKKDNGEKLLTKFCASTSNNLGDIGLCYHGIGHTLINQITTLNDKEFISTLTASCSNLKNPLNIKETSASLQSKNSYASDPEIKELVVKSCFLGGFDEYLHKKLTSTKYTPGQIDTIDCANIDIILVKDCHALIYQYIISEQILDTTLTIDTIYPTFAQKCLQLTSKNEIEIKVKEGCFKAIPKSYINTTLMGNLKYKDRNAPNLLDLNVNELYSLINKLCTLDYNNSCSVWFLIDIKEKLIPSDYTLLLSKFEDVTLEALKNTN